MKAFLACMTACISVGASAQAWNVSPTMNQPNFDTFRSSLEARGPNGLEETPAMRREKMQRAVALRAEAATLLAQDNGRFTPEHEAYIRQKACAIVPSANCGR